MLSLRLFYKKVTLTQWLYWWKLPSDKCCKPWLLEGGELRVSVYVLVLWICIIWHLSLCMHQLWISWLNLTVSHSWHTLWQDSSDTMVEGWTRSLLAAWWQLRSHSWLLQWFLRGWPARRYNYSKCCQSYKMSLCKTWHCRHGQRATIFTQIRSSRTSKGTGNLTSPPAHHTTAKVMARQNQLLRLPGHSSRRKKLTRITFKWH